MAEEEQKVRHEAIRGDAARKEAIVKIADDELAMQGKGQKIGLFVTVACVALAFASACLGFEKWWAFLLVPTASFIASFMPGVSSGIKKPTDQ